MDFPIFQSRLLKWGSLIPSFFCLTFTPFLGQNRKQELLSDLLEILGLPVRYLGLIPQQRKQKIGPGPERRTGRWAKRLLSTAALPAEFPAAGRVRASLGEAVGTEGTHRGRSLETEAGHLCESFSVSRPTHLSSIMLGASSSQDELHQPPLVRTCDSSLTCLANIGHGELAILGLVASQLQGLQQAFVLYLLRLQVDGRLSLAPAGGVVFGPVRLI